MTNTRASFQQCLDEKWLFVIDDECEKLIARPLIGSEMRSFGIGELVFVDALTVESLGCVIKLGNISKGSHFDSFLHGRLQHYLEAKGV